MGIAIGGCSTVIHGYMVCTHYVSTGIHGYMVCTHYVSTGIHGYMGYSWLHGVYCVLTTYLRVFMATWCVLTTYRSVVASG